MAAALNRGKILGLIPKVNLPNYAEYYEARQFAPADGRMRMVELGGEQIPFGTRILFSCLQMPRLVVAAEICEDLWAPAPPSVEHAMAGATMIVNLSAGDEITGKDTYRRNLVTGQSARLVCGYLYADRRGGRIATGSWYWPHTI